MKARLYATYRFGPKEKDPVIHATLTLVQDIARAKGVHEKAVIAAACAKSRVSERTADNWFNGETRAPQNPTMEAFIRGLEAERVLVPREYLKAVKALIRGRR